MAFISKWHGENAIILQNSYISTVILPNHGGKAASLFYISKEFELLFQNPHKDFKKAVYGSDFSKFEACGFDDAFPTIDSCEVPINGYSILYPDHGEIWSAVFDYVLDKKSVTLTYDSKILPYRYEKRFMLEQNSLYCNYKIQNTGKFEFPYLWAFHCLVNCEKDMRLIYPSGVTSITNVFNSKSLGKIGNKYHFSEALCELPKDPMNKFYITGKVQNGTCGYYYPKKDVTALIKFNPSSLPYLGFWCTNGGYRGDINCAFEPATGFYDSALSAYRNKTGSVLYPNETFSFRIVVTLK